MNTIFLLKNKGTTKIPDYIQIRDQNFNLLDHIRFLKTEKEIEQINYIVDKERFLKIIAQLEYGKIVKIEL